MATNRVTFESNRAEALAPALPVQHRAAHLGAIEQSHQRCAALGLTRIERPDYAPLMRSDLAVARERNRRLYQHAAPVMEMLFEQIVDTQSMIVLTDAHGTILHSIGDDDFLARASKVALSPGVNWAEHSKGTNAIGTALFEERPTLVHANEHFMQANHFLTCSAVPIFDPRGSMLGVLDVSGDHRSYHQHTMGLVRMSARMIENQWLNDDGGKRLRLHFHSRAEFIGTLLEGIVIVAFDGKILGGNRCALEQLAMSGAQLRGHSVTTLFGTTVAMLFDHFRAPQQAPLRVSLPSGAQFHVSARFDADVRTSLHPGPRGMGADAPVVAHPPRAALPRPAQAAQAAPTALPTESKLDWLRTGDPHMEDVVRKARRILDRKINLLILGEAGTGKEILARAMHQDSNRAAQPFIAVNCAALPQAQMETELFGTGAATGIGTPDNGTAGRIAQARRGTLFLDEVDALPLPLQARLLHALHERSVALSGADSALAVEGTIIAATRTPLRDLIQRQLFREDLYYRLNGLVLSLPALRERSDIAAVAQRILQAHCPHDTPDLSAQLLERFRRYAWPGNLRQLATVLRTAVVMANGEPCIAEAHLSQDILDDLRASARATAPPHLTSIGLAAHPGAVHTDPSASQRHAVLATLPSTPPSTLPVTPPALSTSTTLDAAEIELIRNALAAANGNISLASKRLGISRNTIYRRLRWNAGNTEPPATA